MDFSEKNKTIKKQNLYRKHRIIDDSIINFCSNDYLSLKNHPQVIEAFKKGLNQFGAGSGSSHLVSGHSKAHQKLQEALANYTNQENAILFSTGYMANIGVFSALKEELNWVLQDKLNHASLLDANQLIALKIQRYLHNNIVSLENKIKKQDGNGMVVTDNIFSMEGDKANINAIYNIVKNKDAIFMQDDAHGFGLFEPDIPNNSIYMATLGKSAGLMGAFVAGNYDFIEFLIQKSRPYIYTTAISPAVCIAALKSLELIIQGEQKIKLFENIYFFNELSKELEIPINHSKSAIQPLIVKSNEKALSITDKLLKSGFYVNAIRPPTVAKNSSRLRITLNANHTKAEIEKLLITLKNAL